MNIQINQFLFFILFSLGSLISILFIIFLDNVLYSLLFLILFFINISGILFLLEVEYLAIMVILIYVSAVSVFFLFIIMTIDLSYIENKKTKKEYKEEKKWVFIGISSLYIFILSWNKVFEIVFGFFSLGINEFSFGDRLIQKENVNVFVSFPKPVDIFKVQRLPYKNYLIPSNLFGDYETGYLSMGREFFEFITQVDDFFESWCNLLIYLYIGAVNGSVTPSIIRRIYNLFVEDYYFGRLFEMTSSEILDVFKKYIILNKESLEKDSHYHTFMDRDLVGNFVYPKELAWGKNLVYNFCSPLEDNNILPLKNFFITTEKYYLNKIYDSPMDMHTTYDIFFPFYNECYFYLIFLGLILLISLIGIVLLTNQKQKKLNKTNKTNYNLFYYFS